MWQPVWFLEAEYESSGDIPRCAEKRTTSLKAHLDRVLSGAPQPPKWVGALRESGHSFEEDTVTEWVLPMQAETSLRQKSATWDRLDITKEVFQRSGLLLRAPGLFYRYEAGNHHYFQPSAKLMARMLLGGNLLLRGTHPMTLHFLEGQVLLDELHDEVVGNEWPVFLADPNKPPPLETVHDAPDFPHYLSLWHDFYHALRHWSWPRDLRQSLPIMDQAVRDVSRGEPFIDRVRVNILSGPEPTHFRTYGFFGSVFLAIGGEGLKGQHNTRQAQDFIYRFRNRLGRLFTNHPQHDEMIRGFDALMVQHTSEKERDRL